jgi:hypothetical protein
MIDSIASFVRVWIDWGYSTGFSGYNENWGVFSGWSSSESDMSIIIVSFYYLGFDPLSLSQDLLNSLPYASRCATTWNAQSIYLILHPQ